MLNLDLIRQRRKDRGFSLEYMAENVGYQTANGYWCLETGKVKATVDRLIAIARTLGLRYDDIL